MCRFLAFIYFLILSNLLVKGQSIQKIDSINEYSFKIRSIDRDSSRILAYKALDLSNTAHYSRGVALSQLNLGIHYCNKNRLDSASKYIDFAYTYLYASNDKHNLAITAWYKGKLYQKLSNFKRAYAYNDMAIRLFEELKDNQYLTYVLTERGTYYIMQNNYPKALEYYLKTYKMNSGNTVEDSMRINANIANVYLQMNMPDEALTYAETALEAAYSFGRKSEICLQLQLMGDIYYKKGNDDRTRFYYNKGLAYARQSKHPLVLSEMLDTFAGYYQDKENYKKANSYLLEAEKLGSIENFTSIYLKLSKNYEERGIKDSAFYYAHKAVKLAKQRASPEHLLLAFEMLMNFYDGEKEYDSAYFYSKKIYGLTDSIYNESRDKRFDNLKVQLETLEKENEINVLKFERFENKVRNRIFTIVAVSLLLTLVISFWAYRVTQRRKHLKLEERKKQLEKELEISQKKLSNHTLSMIQKNNVFEDIETELKGIRARCTGNIDPGLKKIQNEINLSRSLENDWSNFSSLFGELHSTFFSYFEKQHSELSDYELRLCALIKMKLTNKEIATMLNIEHKSVKMAKYRLKKKLGIGEAVTLSDFIARVE